MEDKYLSVIIPAYNEQERLENTLESMIRYLEGKKYSYEIIIVNDGSTDGTGEIAQKYSQIRKNIRILTNDTKKGKGYSVKRGMLDGDGKYLLFSDSDMSTPIEEEEKLIGWLGQGYDIAIGSRSMKESRIIVHQAWHREMMGKIFNKFVRLITVRGLIDTQCGFKVFRRECAKKLFGMQKLDGFAFDVEILFLAKKHDYKIKEVPVQWRNSPHTKVNALRDPLNMMIELVKIRLIH